MRREGIHVEHEREHERADEPRHVHEVREGRQVLSREARGDVEAVEEPCEREASRQVAALDGDDGCDAETQQDDEEEKHRVPRRIARRVRPRLHAGSSLARHRGSTGRATDERARAGTQMRRGNESRSRR